MGTFWYTLAPASPTGIFAVFYKQNLPRSLGESGAFDEIMPWFWALNVTSILKRKLLDKEDYDIRLRQAFDDGSLRDQDFRY